MKKKSEGHYSFFRHFSRNLAISVSVTLLILLLGMIGYHYFEEVDWIDAYVNCALIIAGVGMLINPQTMYGKLFVSTYALVGGGAFLLVVGVIFSPIFHWITRQIHIEDRDYFK